MERNKLLATSFAAWREGSLKLVDVGSPAYEEFNRSMDEALTRLVARWEHAAAPAARRGISPRLQQPT